MHKGKKFHKKIGFLSEILLRSQILMNEREIFRTFAGSIKTIPTA
jgi:hypothetical protein